MTLVLTGPSCSGKTTFAERLENCGYAKRIVTYTTRRPRPDEMDGVDYHFVSTQKFKWMLKQGEFVEYDFLPESRTYYGSKMEDYEREGTNVVSLTPEGLTTLRQKEELKPFIYVLYFDLDYDICYKRALERGDDERTVKKRLEEDKLRFCNFSDYNALLKTPEDVDLMYRMFQMVKNNFYGVMDNPK